MGVCGSNNKKNQVTDLSLKISKKLFVAGNWKCNPSFLDAQKLVTDVYSRLEFDSNKIDVLITPIALHIPAVLSSLSNGVQVGAQNCSLTNNGQFTGELSATQIKEFGINWVILGHPDRRSKFSEDNILVANKLKMAVAQGLKVILCVGEQLADKENGDTNAILKAQLDACLAVIDSKDWENVVLAYDPVWASGTGKGATPEVAEETHLFLSEYLNDKITNASGLRIIYGGSVNDTNCKELISQPHIDGFLIGGASLKPIMHTIVKVVNDIQK